VAKTANFGHISPVQNDLAHPDAVAAHTARWPARLKSLAAAVLVVGVYVALEWVSFIHEYKGLPVTPWNPGLGVVFALMLYGGPRYAAVLFVGVLAAELVVLRTSLALPMVVGIAAITAGGYGAIAAVIRPKLNVGLQRLPDVMLLLAAGAVGAFLVASMLSLLLIADAQLDVSDVLVASGPLLVGDAIGIAVMTPLTLRVLLRARYLSSWELRALGPEVALYVAVVVLILWVVGLTESENGFKLFYLLFLPVVVTAIRYGLDGSCLGLALTQLGLVGLMHRHGYDANVFTEFQILMLVLTATGLTVGATVSERRQANRMIRDVEARLREREAEAAQAARFNLVSGMASALAHEINQPITAARALGRAAQEILKAQQPDHGRADSNLSTMIAQIDHAASVVRRMRDFLRRGHPHISTVEIAPLISEALSLIRAEADAKQIRIDFEIPADMPPAHVDRIQMQQMILNLARNSIDAIASASHDGGWIRIVASHLDSPDRIEVSVTDSGPGIDPTLASRLFEPLVTSKHDGFGLGLSICATIAQSHHGRLWLQSGAAGATEFRFSLPLRYTS
jgi:two-component system sensor kinase FixL